MMAVVVMEEEEEEGKGQVQVQASSAGCKVETSEELASSAPSPLESPTRPVWLCSGHLWPGIIPQ